MKHLINDFYLDTDKMNYVLCERKIKKSGKLKGAEFYEPIAFYSNLPSLKRGILNKIILEDFVNVELTELLNNIDKIILKMEGIK